ncbi:odorant receptor 4 isoform X1 [Halyomorpha halys]|uniref:odorant receptor 4 isoform X1 n=1 Tax=Halyomorpha halys TaxID=286706 RepID=UPI0034D1AFCB|nr:Odorant receptor 18 [Halyomorpha halys]
MNIIDKFTDYFESIDTSDEDTNRFIDEKYKGCLQITLLYVKLDRKNIHKTCIQYFFYVLLVFYHWIIVIVGLIDTVGINFILYSKGAYYLGLIQMTFCGIITIAFYRDKLVIFHRSMSKNFYDYKEKDTEFIDRFRKECDRDVKLFSLVPTSTIIGAVMAFVLSPALDKYGTYIPEENSSLNINLPAPIIAYHFSTQDNMGFFFAYFLQVCTGCVVIFIIAGGGYLYIVMVQNVCCQLKILIYSVEKLEERADECYYQMCGLKMKYTEKEKFSDQLYDFCYNQCLKKNFEHHQTILRLFDCVRHFFSIPVFMAYLIASIVIALSLLANNIRELPGTSINSSVLGCIEVSYVAFISFLGQEIIDLNDELRVKMYETRWYYASNRVKNSIKIFQQMTLKPLVIMSASIVPINLDTFAVVMNSAYSYYNLINAFSD